MAVKGLIDQLVFNLSKDESLYFQHYEEAYSAICKWCGETFWDGGIEIIVKNEKDDTIKNHITICASCKYR